MSLVKDTRRRRASRSTTRRRRAPRLMQRGGTTGQRWGTGVAPTSCAHSDDKMTCYTCHSSWATSCSGCHLPIQANWKTERHHYEGGETRNYATYNPQVARDDMFQLGAHGPVKGDAHRAGALLARRWCCPRPTPTASASTSSSRRSRPAASARQAFAPHFPHTERKTETKTCTDCHLSRGERQQRDHGAAAAARHQLRQLRRLQRLGRRRSDSVEAVQVTEWDEPQAVIGSYLHRYAYPDWFARAREARAARLPRGARRSHATAPARCLQLRGEYLYVAEGAGGLRVYDVANIANKGFSERIITAPFSPLGHDTHVRDEGRHLRRAADQPADRPGAQPAATLMRADNLEQPIHPIYSYAFVTDAEEGLILVDVDTLADGEPRNNFLERALTWNPDGVLNGARHVTIGGHFAYVAADAGLVVVDLDDPLQPDARGRGRRCAAPRASGAAVPLPASSPTPSGLQVVDVTAPGEAARSSPARGAAAPTRSGLYVARTYAYVAAGSEGLAIVDVERPEAPRSDTMYNADGKLNDARDVVVGATNASLFAYVADGANGLKVLQLTSPDTQPSSTASAPSRSRS